MKLISKKIGKLIKSKKVWNLKSKKSYIKNLVIAAPKFYFSYLEDYSYKVRNGIFYHYESGQRYSTSISENIKVRVDKEKFSVNLSDFEKVALKGVHKPLIKLKSKSGIVTKGEIIIKSKYPKKNRWGLFARLPEMENCILLIEKPYCIFF